MSNTNSDNIKNCDYCYSCDYCDYCNSCDYCDYCYSCNSCDYCKGLRMSEFMLFCLGEGGNENKGIGYQQNYMVFNKKVTSDEYNSIKNSLPGIKISHTYWVDKDDMTDEEKNDNSQYEQFRGFLKHISYEEAWANWWKEASKNDRQAILDIPQFDSEIFKGITGISIEKETIKKYELLKKADEFVGQANKLKKEAENL